MSQGTPDDLERHSPNLTIDNLPTELLLEIFDAYRQHFDYGYKHQRCWNTSLTWFKLIHVCRKWRHVVFTSMTHLNLYLILETRHRDRNHRDIILSRHFPPLPIVIDCHFGGPSTPEDQVRLLSTLKLCDRVHGISVFGRRAPDFAEFFEQTKRPFPTLKSLKIYHEHLDTLELPPTFIGGSAPSLRCLKINPVSFASISPILSSATQLVDLSLVIELTFSPSQEESLLAYLKAMPCLRHLSLIISDRSINSLAHPSEPEDIVTLFKLTDFHYHSPSVVLDILVAGFTAPSLQELCIGAIDTTALPVPHLPQFINAIGKAYHSLHLYFRETVVFRIELLTEAEYVGRRMPSFTFYAYHFPDSMMQTNSAFSAKFATLKELRITFMKSEGDTTWQDVTPWRRFLQQFCSVKVIRLERGSLHCIADSLKPKHGEPILDFLPFLEEIELCVYNIAMPESELAAELAAFQPFVSAREQAGCPIRVYRSVKSMDPWNLFHGALG